MRLTAHMHLFLLKKPVLAALDLAGGGAGPATAQPAAVHMPQLEISAVFPAGRGTPMLGRDVELVSARGIVAAVAHKGAEIPLALRPFTPAVYMETGAVFTSLADVQKYLERNHTSISRQLLSLADCFERRILLVDPCTDASGKNTTEQGRITARLAQTARELSLNVCRTPPNLLPPVSGNVRMALSLLITKDKADAAAEALSLAERLLRAHGLVLHMTRPEFVESFPIRELPTP